MDVRARCPAPKDHTHVPVPVTTSSTASPTTTVGCGPTIVDPIVPRSGALPGPTEKYTSAKIVSR